MRNFINIVNEMAYDSHLDPKRLNPGVIDGSAQNIFSTGGCHALAIAIHDATGWPIVAITDHHNVFDGRAGGGSAVHWCVKAPNGKFVDIDGAHDPAELTARYDSDVDYDEDTDEQVAHHGLSSRADAEEQWENQGRKIPVKVAAKFVDAVLKKAGYG